MAPAAANEAHASARGQGDLAKQRLVPLNEANEVARRLAAARSFGLTGWRNDAFHVPNASWCRVHIRGDRETFRAHEMATYLLPQGYSKTLTYTDGQTDLQTS